jgi:hypothetical protein
VESSTYPVNLKFVEKETKKKRKRKTRQIEEK